MDKLIFKLKLWVYNEGEDKDEWVDFYLNVREIIGWYVPPTPPDEIGWEKGPNIVHIYIHGDVFSVKQEPHIKEYLLNECYIS